jgi:acyl-CoA synthetase (AMP-forming)/AMP-acid ligase II
VFFAPPLFRTAPKAAVTNPSDNNPALIESALMKTAPAISGLTVGAVVANAARATPNATAAVIGDTPHTFAQLHASGSVVADSLVAAGLPVGAVALVLADTSFDLLAHFVGCARAGVVFAPLNPNLDAATMAALNDRIQPAVVLAGPGHAELAQRFDAPALWVDLATASADDHTNPRQIAPTAAHIAFFTSGSTGTPKAAVVSHQASVLRSHPGSQLEARGSALCPYPLFHMAGWTISMQQWHARAAVVFVDGTDAATLVPALQHHKIERFNAIPALWIRLAEYLAEHTTTDGAGALPHLRFADTGTSPTSLELLESIAAMAPNAHVRVFYGSSEAGNVASLHHHDLGRKPNSCGQPSLLTTLRVDLSGELLVHGPLLFTSYLADPEATAAAFTDDGWYRTGDRAELDSEGYLTIVGRVGTVIRTGGESVSPDVVESAVISHPGVGEVVAFGVPDPAWGESVWVAIVPADAEPAAAPSLAELRSHLGPDGAAPLAKHQIPRHLLVLEEIPRTVATGQVDRHRLRTLAGEAPGAGTDLEGT